MDIGDLIEQCKQEIRYAADWACVPYDEEDLQIYSCKWGTVVAIKKLKLPMLAEENGRVVEVGPKRPNLWIEGDRVRVLCPFLIRIILPDRTISRGECCFPTLQRMKEEDIRQVVLVGMKTMIKCPSTESEL